MGVTCYGMHMLTRRLQILLDEDRYGRISLEADRRGVAVAVVVREAIDASYPSDAERRERAFQTIFAAEPMEVPDDPADLKREIEEGRSRWG